MQISASRFFLLKYFVICCKVCATLIDILLFTKVGALTSKSFAFKAWSWELNSTFIVDLTNFLGEWIRVDLKGLEIVRVLPWLDSWISETWISDKTRFFYDGLSLNQIVRFYLWKKFFFLPLFYFCIHLKDKLFWKYISAWPVLKFFWKLSQFWNDKENFYIFYFKFYSFLNQYIHLYTNYCKFYRYAYEFKFGWSLVDLNFKGWIFRWFLLKKVKKKKNRKFLYWVMNQFILYRMIRLKKWVYKFMHRWKTYSSLSNLNFLKLIFFNIFLTPKRMEFNFLLDSAVDILSLSLLKTVFIKIRNYNTQSKINFKCEKNNINLFLPIKVQNFFYGQNWFWILNSFKGINDINVIFLISANLWLLNPKLHIYFWKSIKLRDLLVISVGNVDNLLFKHLNFGFDIQILNSIFFAQNWLCSFLIKWKNIAFFFNFDQLNLYSKKIFKFNDCLVNKILKFYFFTSLKWLKFYFITKFYFFYFSKTVLTNMLVNLKLSKNESIKKNLLFSNFFFKPKLFINVGLEKIRETFFLDYFSKDFFNLKRYFYVLVESNILWKNLAFHWDFVFPIVGITENFVIFWTAKQTFSKSLFIKFGSWLARTFFNYIKLFFNFSLFPFFWIFKMKKLFSDVLALFLDFWLLTPPKVCTIFRWKVINISRLNIFNFEIKNIFSYISIFKNLNINIWNFFFSTNFWFSELSFLKTSKYNSMGYDLVKVNLKTFF